MTPSESWDCHVGNQTAEEFMERSAEELGEDVSPEAAVRHYRAWWNSVMDEVDQMGVREAELLVKYISASATV